MTKHCQYYNKAKPYSKDKPLDFKIDFSLDFLMISTSIPKDIKLKKNPRLIFKYPRNIGSKVLNYNKTLGNTGKLTYADILDMNCDCADSPFKHNTHNHVITGDLKIVKEEGLRQLLSYGTKFREIPLLNIKEIKASIKRNLRAFCSSWL